MTEEQYIKDLENTISKFLKPIKNIPFNVVIKVLSGYSIIPFNKDDVRDIELLEKLTISIDDATKKANLRGIFTKRANEAGNSIEPFVKDSLISVGLDARTPLSKTGKRKGSGYPDIEIKERDGRFTYLECKTYNIKNVNTTQRTFYLSPSESFKITVDARHLLVSFEIVNGSRNNQMAYIPINWKLYTLDKLKVNLKNEFQAANRILYLNDSLLAQGKVE